jgi:hypothetical protein
MPMGVIFRSVFTRMRPTYAIGKRNEGLNEDGNRWIR